MSDTTQSKNELELLGQRFHPVVGFSYFGLGLFVGGALAHWFPDGSTWRGTVALATFAAGVIWWIVLWRTRKPPSV